MISYQCDQVPICELNVYADDEIITLTISDEDGEDSPPIYLNRDTASALIAQVQSWLDRTAKVPTQETST